MPVVKAVLVTLVIALSLTSDTVLSSKPQASPTGSWFRVHGSRNNSLTKSFVCVGTGPTPIYWESQNWTLPPLMLPSE